MSRLWHIGPPPLFDFSSPFAFTNCGATGAVGPQNCSSAYTQYWTNISSFFSIVGNGTQQWTVPQTGAAAACASLVYNTVFP